MRLPSTRASTTMARASGGRLGRKITGSATADLSGNQSPTSQARAPDGCRFPDRHTAIPPSFLTFEPVLQTLRNVGGRIQTTSESRKVHQYRGYDKAAVRRMVNTLFLRRYDGIFPRKYFDVPLGLNSTKPLFSELE